MDYLDPKKELRHRIIMLVGYVLIAVAIALTGVVLLYQAYGYGVNNKGAVIQKALTFFSSQPHPAKIYLNNQLQTVTTNKSLLLPEGIYNVRLTRQGYRDWQRSIELDGGKVAHFDYPFLFPKTLTTKKIAPYAASPGLFIQSPDQRWLIISQPGNTNVFDVYDLKNPSKLPATALTLPPDLLTKGTSESWHLDEWADDNQHVLLEHDYDGKTEFILLDRAHPDQSLNLNRQFSANPTKITLRDKKYDKYYLYGAPAASLQAASLKSPDVAPVLQHVLAYQSYGSDTILYVTDKDEPAGSAMARMQVGDKTYNIRRLPAAPGYLADLTEYSGTMYVAVGSVAGDRVYIFQDPVGQLTDESVRAPAPIQVLHVPQPNYLSFSANTQFIVVSNGDHMGVYDIENDNGYNYTSPWPLDTPQTHPVWMDGDRLTMVSGAKVVVFDYDNANQQVLVSASSSFAPAFAPDYKNMYVLAPSATAGQLELAQVSLLTPADR